jgi:NADH-quinone oxidoreductase subunit J
VTGLFIIAGLMAIAGVLGVIFAKAPIHQVLATVLSFFGLAALYLSLEAEFMAVIQMIVYGGAVMILFLFVIGLLSANQDPVEKEKEDRGPALAIGFALGGAILAMLAIAGLTKKIDPTALAKLPEGFGTVKAFGAELLTTNLLPFEILAFVLMVAVVGVVILVGRQKG